MVYPYKATTKTLGEEVDVAQLQLWAERKAQILKNCQKKIFFFNFVIFSFTLCSFQIE
jgi:hypothetical protein